MENMVSTTSGLEMALAIWHRRKWLVLLVILSLLSATVAVVRRLPTIYQSTATVLVGRQQAAGGLVGPSADSGLETKLRTISEQILSRSRLYELITRFDLYQDQRQRMTPDAAVERMRRDIQVQFHGAPQPSGENATIWLSLSYRGRDPEMVARVTNALAVLFREENARMSKQQTAGTTDFLRAQLEDAKQKLEEQDQRVTQFKARHIGELPEELAANFAALARLNERSRMIMTQREELIKQLGTVPGAGSSGDAISTRLAKLRQELADLRTRYTDEHPDVLRVKQEITDLERRITSGDGHAPAEDSAGPRKDIPTPAEAELATLRNQEQAVQRAIAAYEQRIEMAPLTEQELQQLSRDYVAAQQFYQSLLQRYEDAQLAERMQQHLQDEQFRILDPAVPSRQPVGPHRARLVLMGVMISMVGASGAALLAEARDSSFHTVDDVRAFTSVPVLMGIPPIVTGTDVRRRQRLFALVAVAAALGVAVIFTASSFLAHSTDVLVRLLAGGRF